MTINSETLSIYLHIPFCSTKCTYCAFNTYTNLEILIPEFVSALITEINLIAEHNPYKTVESIYFGGGTPTLLSASQFEQLLSALRKRFHWADNIEISTEANPNDLTLPYLKELHQLGIHRMSIGMQSANQDELVLFDRRHDNQTVIHAMQLAREAEFDNINLDLIYGFPHQTLQTWETSLKQALSLNPEHVSLYALTLEEGTPLKSRVEYGSLPMPDDDLTADMYDLATDYLNKAGYEQYEISNWAKQGYACRHNLQYWYNAPYIGLGPGAHGFAGGVRYATILSPQRYIKALSEGQGNEYTFPHTPAVVDARKLTQVEEIADTLMMCLRLLNEGVSLSGFKKRFATDLLELHGKTFERFVNYGLLEITPDCVRITQKGRLLSNMIFREII
ncbi:MAG: radical SAM family heme chaperone HemW [Anaerolineae bacterium]|nr:radical SAM family heme chaperone HemW [Anaerolineae bacterium]